MVLPLCILYSLSVVLFLIARKRIHAAGDLNSDNRSNEDDDDGLSASARMARAQALRQMRWNVGASACYWVTFGLGSMPLLHDTNARRGDLEESQPPPIDSLFLYWNLLLAMKGLVIACVFGHSMHVGTVFQMWRSGDYDGLMKVQSVTWVLRRELLYFARCVNL